MSSVKMPVEFLYETAVQILAYNRLCDLVQLSEEDRKNPKAGEWLCEAWRSMATIAMTNQQTLRQVKSGIREEKSLSNPLLQTALNPTEEV